MSVVGERFQMNHDQEFYTCFWITDLLTLPHQSPFSSTLSLLFFLYLLFHSLIFNIILNNYGSPYTAIKVFYLFFILREYKLFKNLFWLLNKIILIKKIIKAVYGLIIPLRFDMISLHGWQWRGVLEWFDALFLVTGFYKPQNDSLRRIKHPIHSHDQNKQAESKSIFVSVLDK